ncbi:nucleolar and coiled-body phosphoprotein 1 isoform X2 [Rhinichthys klamathensis goyatoka]|uniref:nucleolar and coiled-body phosphoprotein 1 isoform X2 n=1 Tax=Rhinichthys klamathensis goyatoka TaxID=3034132 RepID=UPI0024B6210C|nr:nucleolar and coiled-body phosphoprotein 1 isoform X2 [Rhinichthys klamathensis goyatoka]
MATSLLRLGRLGSVKCLLREGWSTPKAPFVAALCTKGDVPPKTPKKAKASTIEADERASLLAYKPAVAFPSKLSAAGFLLKDVALGKSETAEAVSTAAANETTTDSPVAETAAADIAVEEAKITEVPPTDGATTEIGGSKTSDVKAEVQKDQDDTSSSSSSDSDSDSDSDDEKPKTETPVQSGEKAAEEKKAPGLTTEEVGVPDKEANPETTAFGEAQESAETVTKATPEEVPAPSAKPVGSVETLIDPAPVISSTSEAVHEVSSESITVATSDNILDSATEMKTAPTEEIAVEKEPEIKVEKEPEIKVEEAVKVSAEVLQEVTTEARSEDVADTTVDAGPEVSSEAPGDVPAPKAEAGTLNAEGTPSEELVDPAPVTADAVEALAETDVVETPEEQAPEKAPAPEPFDNTTYKNLQHHQYDAYTFADLDVEMSKHRLPQPSAARH